jgi:hypothetical protein
MPTNTVNSYTRGNLGISRHKSDPSTIDLPHHVNNMIHGVGSIKVRMGHTWARRELHLLLLQMKACYRKVSQRSSVVEMQMGDDYIGHFSRVNSNHA